MPIILADVTVYVSSQRQSIALTLVYGLYLITYEYTHSEEKVVEKHTTEMKVRDELTLKVSTWPQTLKESKSQQLIIHRCWNKSFTQ